jgi:ribosomal protein S18 acetylase RimI-like enzyme
VYFTFSSTITAKVGVLNDLYTIPEMRGKGVGNKLIEHSHEYAKKNDAVRLQGLTASDNEQAQLLYDSMKINKSSWLLYIT